MAEIRPNELLQLSILDRLIDDPRAGASSTAGYSLKNLRESLTRDLRNLLNTHVLFLPAPDDLPELECSLANYGLPEFTNLNLSSEDDCRRFEEEIQHCIERYEPRLTRIVVKLSERGDRGDRVLRF